MAKILLTVFCACLFVLGFSLNANANELNHGTMVTFASPVEVPGARGPVLLPAGTYVFEASNPLGNHAVVQIFNKDKSRLYVTVLAIPSYRATPTGTAVTLVQNEDGAQQLKSWFYRDSSYGQEFVY